MPRGWRWTAYSNLSHFRGRQQRRQSSENDSQLTEHPAISHSTVLLSLPVQPKAEVSSLSKCIHSACTSSQASYSNRFNKKEGGGHERRSDRYFVQCFLEQCDVEWYAGEAFTTRPIQDDQDGTRNRCATVGNGIRARTSFRDGRRRGRSRHTR